MKLALRDYQQPHMAKLLTSLLSNNFAHDGSDAGTGKTYVGAALVKAFSEETLIVAPLSVLPSWQEALDGFECTNYTLTNYEKAWRREGEVKPWGAGSFFQFHRKFGKVVMDEAHRCGGDTTINSKMMIAAKRQGAGLLTLSATIAESPLKMKAFGFAAGLHHVRDYTDFLLRCQCKHGTFGGWTFSAKSHPLILAGLQHEIYEKGLGSRMRKSEIPGFPKTVLEVRTLGNPDRQLMKMSAELRSYYNERTVSAHQLEAKLKKLRADAVADGRDPDTVAGFSELTRITFLRQAMEAAKVPMIADMITDALEHSKVAVFCNYHVTIDQLTEIAKKRGWTFGFIHGEQTATERTQAIKAFQRNELDVIFCISEAGGVGVSLHDPVDQVERTAIICPQFSGIVLKQVLGRVNRADGGYSRQILIFFEDSIEGHVARVVRSKLDAIDMINDAELLGDFS